MLSVQPAPPPPQYPVSASGLGCLSAGLGPGPALLNSSSSVFSWWRTLVECRHRHTQCGDTHTDQGHGDMAGIHTGTYCSVQFEIILKSTSNKQIKVKMYIKDLQEDDFEIALKVRKILFLLKACSHDWAIRCWKA